MRCVHTICSIVGVACLTAAAFNGAGAAVIQDHKLLAEDGAANNYFGYSVGIDSGRMVVGAYYDDDNGSKSGSAYLFDAATGNQTTKLTASDGAAEDWFGRSVGISGDWIVAGAYGDDDKGAESGSAYLFDATTGNQTAKLTASDGVAEDWFGSSVAIGGDRVLVGAYRKDNGGSRSGAVYLFNAASGNQLFKLTASDGAAYDYFGDSVAVSGDLVAVGAWADDDNGNASGSAYVFDATTGNQLFKLTASDGAQYDYFGRSVAISGDRVVVGADGDDDNGEASGSAYVFDATNGNQLYKLTAPDGAGLSYFGQSVAISGDRIVIGAHGDSVNALYSGSAYLFDAVSGAFLEKITAADWAEQDHFGISVAISNETLAIGASSDDDNGRDSGSAYLFHDTSQSSVPLPGSLPLLGLGTLLLAATRRAKGRA